tara:strand:+ start:449 stop:1276 length:828 start_codon:yes stop_codon:yes gene_type:complete
MNLPKMPSPTNPLALLAIFVWLNYGVAALFFSYGESEFSGALKWVMVLFIVLYPIGVFIGFLYLVIKHHTKLYAPMDYGDPTLFLKLADPVQVGERLQEEARALEDQGESVSNSVVRAPQVRPSVANAALVERLAFQKLQEVYSGPVQREVRLYSGKALIEQKEGQNTAHTGLVVDGVIHSGSSRVFVEIKFANAERFKEPVNQAMRLMKDLASSLGGNANKFVVVIVLAHEGQKSFDDAEAQIQRLAMSHKKVDVIIYSFHGLLKEFGLVGVEG